VFDEADVETVWRFGLLRDPRCFVFFDPNVAVSVFVGFCAFEAAFCERGFGGY
jgi:hypothetical protein